jgi:predicted transcriptional regulator of viral defense system
VVAAIAQKSVLSLEQLEAFGVTRRQVYRWCQRGQLFRRYRSVYSIVPPQLLSRDGELAAAVLACQPDAVISHRSAAALLALRADNRGRIDVTIPARHRRRLPGIDLHWSGTLTAEDVVRARGLRCTSVERAALDCADVLSLHEMKRMFEEMEATDRFDLAALQDQINRAPTRPAARALARALDDYTYGFGVPFSEMERAFRALIAPHPEIPEPLVNQWVDLGDGEPRIRPDFHWPELRIVVHTDSWKYHRSRGKYERDYRNAQRFTLAGWRPLGLTYGQVTKEGERVIRTLLALIAATPPSEGWREAS